MSFTSPSLNLRIKFNICVSFSCQTQDYITGNFSSHTILSVKFVTDVLAGVLSALAITSNMNTLESIWNISLTIYLTAINERFYMENNTILSVNSIAIYAVVSFATLLSAGSKALPYLSLKPKI